MIEFRCKVSGDQKSKLKKKWRNFDNFFTHRKRTKRCSTSLYVHSFCKIRLNCDEQSRKYGVYKMHKSNIRKIDIILTFFEKSKNNLTLHNFTAYVLFLQSFIEFRWLVSEIQSVQKAQVTVTKIGIILTIFDKSKNNFMLFKKQIQKLA